ncbi:MAG: hypothetical protein CMO80_06015 [Verrucomicrobiales bacterium]|nr:hypothetical protein [Verrucomicrobiales bacterium]|tara:strand:+ start:293 stop:583 length:291 start_codon:yes stop_codon:yes gene_type:complete
MPDEAARSRRCGASKDRDWLEVARSGLQVLDDPKDLFTGGEDNSHNRTIKFQDGDKIPWAQIKKWVKAACENYLKGVKPKKKKSAKPKTVAVPELL